MKEKRNQRKKKSKKERIKGFFDSTRVCDSSRISGATDMDMSYRVQSIVIPGTKLKREYRKAHEEVWRNPKISH
jgi:hypothetical protein